MDLCRNNVASLDLTPGKAELCTDSMECRTDKKSEMNDKDLVEFSCSKVDNSLFPDDTDVSDMLQGTGFNGTLPTVTDRYFTPYYQINAPKSGDDICIRVHSNRICMISLAPSHTVLQEGKRIVKINFKISDKVDRSSNKVSGKSKHGAQPLQPDSSICSIICSDGETYVIKCCMTGKLVEVNELLLENPEMLLQPPHRGGYLAIALPNIKLIDEMKKKWLTQDLYYLAIQRRQSQSKITNLATQSNTDESSRDDSAEKKVLKRKQNDESPINCESPCEREAKVIKENDTESL